MKCLLLLLAFGLVYSDKLDRTYLPPPGAKLAGGSLEDLQIPLEYPEPIGVPTSYLPTYLPPIGVIQNGQFPSTFQGNPFSKSLSNQDNGDGESKSTTVDFSRPMYYNKFGQLTSIPANEYGSTVATLRSGLGSYNSFPPKLPSTGYLPSQRSTMKPLISDLSLRFKAPSSNGVMGSNANGEKSGYYYYVPLQPNHGNVIEYTKPNEGVSSNTQYSEAFNNPNQNDGFLPFTPKLATTNDIAQNYQPSVFGYYGGNPMIMTYQNSSPQEPGKNGFTSKFGDFENVLPEMAASENKQNGDNKSSRLFQPSSYPQNAYKSNNVQTFTSPSTFANLPQMSSSSYQQMSKENIPITFEQRNSVPVGSEFRYERPQAESERNAVILKYENVITPEGYSYNFDTSNGIHAEERATATNGVKAIGSYSYIGDDGRNYSVSYTADENGFRPIGDHLPTPPPVPEAIKKVIEQAARDKATGIVDDGSYDERKYGHMNYHGAISRYSPIKKSNLPNVVPRSGVRLNEPNTIQQNPTASTGKENNKERNNIQPYNAYILKSRSKPINGSQFESISSQYPALNQQEPNNGLNNKNDKNGFNTKPVKSQRKYLRRPGSSKKDVQQNGNTNNSYLQENKDTSTTASAVDMAGVYNDLQDQSRRLGNPVQKKQSLSTNARTPGDDGYYYVPPFIKFNQTPEQSDNEKNSYLTTNKPLQKDITNLVSKRIGADNTPDQQTIDQYNLSGTTRKPYITGPVDQTKTYEYTTPMPSTKYQNQPKNGYPNQYQTTTNPAIFEQTLPSTVENRVNIGSEIPGISVSQKFVSTTNSPVNLEVNQNVNIYGLGEPKPITSVNGYLDRVPNFNNRYTSIVNEESRFTGYPDVRPTGKVFDETTEKGTIGNDYNIGLGSPANGNPAQTVTYPNPDFESQQLNSADIPNTPISAPNVFGNGVPLPGQVTSPTFINQIQTQPENVIGEDFSGPNQPQEFDPETGY